MIRTRFSDTLPVHSPENSRLSHRAIGATSEFISHNIIDPLTEIGLNGLQRLAKDRPAPVRDEGNGPTSHEVMDPGTLETVIKALDEEFGEGNVVSAVIFGSTTRAANKANSDYDFTVITKDLPIDIYERDAACPRIKRRLRELGIRELCAFNLYTPEEFTKADDQNVWLIETMKAGYKVVHDTDDYLTNILGAQSNGVSRVGNKFAWKGVEFVQPSRFESTIQNHLEVADLIEESASDLAGYHRSEALRIGLIAKLHEHGESTSRGSIFALAQRLNFEYGEDLDLSMYEDIDFQHEMIEKRAHYGYDAIEQHMMSAALLEEEGRPLDALFHVSMALRNRYLQALHEQGDYIIDGEITQLFLREFGGSLPPELTSSLYEHSFKVEQLLGRSGFLSFDLDKNGLPYYEDPTSSNFDYSTQLAIMRKLLIDLGETLDKKGNGIKSDSAKVSITVNAGNSQDELQATIYSLRNLIVPNGTAKVTIARPNGDLPNFELEKLSDYQILLEAGTIVPPLWLINILSGFNSMEVASTTTSSGAYPHPNIRSIFENYTLPADASKCPRAICVRSSALQKVHRDQALSSLSASELATLNIDLISADYTTRLIDSTSTYTASKTKMPRSIRPNAVKDAITYLTTDVLDNLGEARSVLNNRDVLRYIATALKRHVVKTSTAGMKK